MKKKNLLFGLIVVAAFLMIIPINAAADTYNGAWEPVVSPFFSFDVTPSSGPGSLYLYDWGAISSDLQLISDGTYSFTVVYIWWDTGDSKYYAGFSDSDKGLDLGDDTQFGFYFKKSNKHTLYSIVTNSPNFSYNIIDDQAGGDSSNMEVQITRAAPIPIPSTVWIFGAGLIGLVGIRRKLRS
jgi:hypothetical protein